MLIQILEPSVDVRISRLRRGELDHCRIHAGIVSFGFILEFVLLRSWVANVHYSHISASLYITSGSLFNVDDHL